MQDHPVDYILYSDGSTKTNPGIGAYAAIITDQKTSEETIVTKTFHHTTNNRMEMLGIIEPIEALYVHDMWRSPNPPSIHVFSDSKYVVNTATIWVENWKKNNWKSATGKRSKNIDLLERILIINNNMVIYYTWVKGHANNNYNNRCDVLARDKLVNTEIHHDVEYEAIVAANPPSTIDVTTLP